MKNVFITSAIFLSMVNYAFAQDQNNNQQVVSASIAKCTGGGAITIGELSKCVGVYYSAGISGGKDDNGTDRANPADKTFECKLNSPTNQDWAICKKGIGYYNALALADKGMQVASQVQSTSTNNKLQKDVAAKAAEGNLQTASLEATADKKKSDAKILDQQMAYYGAQAAGLEALVGSWPTKKSKLCKQDNINEAKSYIKQKIELLQVTSDGKGQNEDKSLQIGSLQVRDKNGAVNTKIFESKNCELLLGALSPNELFPNNAARSALQAKALEAMGKSIAAGINANQLRKTAKVAEDLANKYNDPGGDALVELCMVDPTNVKCKSSGTRVNQGNYQAGQFNMDGGGAGQAFNLNPTSGTGEEIGNEGAVGANNVADITSPFSDEADKASKLMDQVGGASYTSAGAGSGGGGGVGGGRGGGGSASLGSDLSGADKTDKEAEIKASKRAGGYGSSGEGGGFKAMGRSGSDDENPLKSLFDEDGAKGGIEEDRSIASEDIDSSNSALFERISKKYAKVAGEKRIEANNLE